MKKIVLATTTFSLLLIFILAACKKDKDQAQTQDVETLLLNKNWKLTVFTIDPAIDFGNGPTNDVLSGWDDCEKDDLYIFKTNGVFVSDEGGLDCNGGSGNQQSTATWSYNKNSKLLTYCIGTTGGCDSYSWTITEISDSQFKAIASENFNNTTYNYKVTFSE